MKGKSIAFGFVVLILLAGGFYLLARPQATKPLTNSAKLIASENSYDFGRISMAMGKVSRTYKIKNTSLDPVTIDKVYTSCMCTEAFISLRGKRHGPFGMPGHGMMHRVGETLAPGEETSVEAIFDPAAHGPAGVGKISRIVTVETGDNEKVDFAFSAEVLP